jgi:isopropylmalate/homocitrate/citramalate synthase
VPAKIRIARSLDAFGIDYLEGGFAASNPKDMEFFEAMRAVPLKHAKLAAFGSTRRAGVAASQDAGLAAILKSGAPRGDDLRQELAAARREGAQDHAGGKPGDDRRIPCAS